MSTCYSVRCIFVQVFLVHRTFIAASPCAAFRLIATTLSPERSRTPRLLLVFSDERGFFARGLINVNHRPIVTKVHSKSFACLVLEPSGGGSRRPDEPHSNHLTVLRLARRSERHFDGPVLRSIFNREDVTDRCADISTLSPVLADSYLIILFFFFFFLTTPYVIPVEYSMTFGTRPIPSIPSSEHVFELPAPLGVITSTTREVVQLLDEP